MAASNGFWDTYRTAWPLLALVDPLQTVRHAAGFIAHAAATGWTPRWSAPAAEDCMTGTTFDLVFADLAIKSLPGLNLEAGYAAALKNATVPAVDPRVGRKGLLPALFRGWVSTEVDEGLAWTLDNAMNDAGIASLALKVAETRVASGSDADPDLDAEAEYLARRALEHEKVFDRDRGFFIGRDPDGGWRRDFDPFEWGRDYTETTAWGTAFTATHDGAGLADMHGGEEALGRALDAMRELQAVRVDGEQWNSISIDHARLAAGCTIEFDLSPAPTRWAAESRPVSMPDVLGHRGQLLDLCISEGTAGSVDAAELLVDDLGATAVAFREGDDVILPLSAPSQVSLLSVTADVAGTFTFTTEIFDAEGRLIATRVISKARFDWDLQTRVFRMPETRQPGVAVRIVAKSPLQVRQFQVFPDTPRRSPK